MTRKRGGRSFGQIRSYRDEITERHTRGILQARLKPKAAGIANPERVAERKRVLEEKGLLSLLEKRIPCPVLLPGNKQGIAIGITADGLVLVKNWEHPFTPNAIHIDKPPRV